jgi:serine/threonine protein kinase
MKTRSRNRTQLRKTIRGGRYIGEGSYGCTFTDPPLKCTTNATRRNRNQLTKLMDPYYAAEELQQSNLFRAIDPAEQYFITANHSCTLNASNIKPENQLDKCKGITNIINPKQLLFYKFGGHDLHDLHPLQPFLYTHMFKSVVNLFDGLQLAHDNHIIHHDIKSENIVSGSSSTGTSLLTRFIDFGFAHKFPIADRDENEELNEQLKDTYIFWPFDIRFLNDDNFVMAKNPAYKKHFEIQYKRWHKKFTEAYSDFLPLFFDFNGDPRLTFDAYYSKTVVEFSAKPLVYTDETVLMAADRYALGLVFLELLRYLQYEIILSAPNHADVIIRSNKLPGGEGYARILDQYGIPDDVAEWHRDVCKHIVNPIFQMCLGLCAYNPLARMSIADAKQHYMTTVFPHIDRLLEQSLVYNGINSVKTVKDFFPPSPAPPSPPIASGAVAVIAPPSVSPKSTAKPGLPKSRRRNNRVKH